MASSTSLFLPELTLLKLLSLPLSRSIASLDPLLCNSALCPFRPSCISLSPRLSDCLPRCIAVDQHISCYLRQLFSLSCLALQRIAQRGSHVILVTAVLIACKETGGVSPCLPSCVVSVTCRRRRQSVEDSPFSGQSSVAPLFSLDILLPAAVFSDPASHTLSPITACFSAE